MPMQIPDKDYEADRNVGLGEEWERQSIDPGQAGIAAEQIGPPTASREYPKSKNGDQRKHQEESEDKILR
jgi:hypothetical protein